jgi:hypothetical protein
MSNVEQLADHQKKRDELIAQYLIFLNFKCAEWLDQKSYESFHFRPSASLLRYRT